jgi:hypothetical protein
MEIGGSAFVFKEPAGIFIADLLISFNQYWWFELERDPSIGTQQIFK